MTEQYVFWMVTGVSGVGLVVIFFAIQQFIMGIAAKFNLLFNRIEDILDRINDLVCNDEFKELETRVRDMEDRMNKCKNCE